MATTALPNKRLATREKAFEYFVGVPAGERVQCCGGELWLPDGLRYYDIVVSWARGQWCLGIDSEPDLQLLRHWLSEGRYVDPELLSRREGSSSAPQRLSDVPTGEAVGGLMTWQCFQRLRVGIREVATAQRARKNASRPVNDASITNHLKGQLKALRTRLEREWSDAHTETAERQLKAQEVTPLAVALLVRRAFEEADAVAATADDGRELQEFFLEDPEAGDIWSIRDFDDGYPSADTGSAAWAQRIVSAAAGFGVESPRDLAAVAGFEPEYVPPTYGDYFSTGDTRKVRARWRSARRGYQARIAKATRNP